MPICCCLTAVPGPWKALLALLLMTVWPAGHPVTKVVSLTAGLRAATTAYVDAIDRLL